MNSAFISAIIIIVRFFFEIGPIAVLELTKETERYGNILPC